MPRYVMRNKRTRKLRKALADRLREVRRLAQAGRCEAAKAELMHIADWSYSGGGYQGLAQKSWAAAYSAIDRCRRRMGTRSR